MKSKSRKDIAAMRKEQLKNAAYKVVSRLGYNSFTIKDIAKEAGLAAGLVHYYFKNKEDLLLNLISEMNRRLRERTLETLADIEDPAQKLKKFVRLAFEQVDLEEGYYHVILDFWSQAGRNERMKKANIRLFSSYHDMIRDILAEGSEKGVFFIDDIEYTAALILSIIHGLAVRYVIDRHSLDFGRYFDQASEHIAGLTGHR